MTLCFPLNLEDILPILPHRPPFLFVDRVLAVEPLKSIVAERTLRATEPQFAGHFPGNPIMPGVLVAEALAQAGGLLLALSEIIGHSAPAKPKMYYLASTNFKFTSPAIPGDVIGLEAKAEGNLAGLHRFSGLAKVNGRNIAGGSFTLAFVPGS